MQHAQLPFLQRRNSFRDIKKDAPLVFALHGDAAPRAKTDSLLAVSLRSLTTKLSVSESQLLFALPKSIINKETLLPIWKVPVLQPGSYDQGKVAYQSLWELTFLQSQQ